MINQVDREQVRRRVRAADPFPHFVLDGFLRSDFAERVCDAFPQYAVARELGREFRTVNEKRKVQITDPACFPEPIAELCDVLSSREVLDLLSYAFEIPNLLADPELVGGGMHETGPRGRLDVHVDFNHLPDRGWYRRLNLLIYFNRDWQREWGGDLELWDADMKRCRQSIAPILNRCVAFATSDTSFHGVTAVNCPPSRTRCSMAVYYYTTEPPPNWTGDVHSTVFRPRPDERLRGAVLMRAERAYNEVRGSFRRFKRRVKGAVRE